MNPILKYGIPAGAGAVGLYGLTRPSAPERPGYIKTTDPFATTVAGSVIGAGLGGAAGYGFGDSRDAVIGAGLGAVGGGLAGYAGSGLFPEYRPVTDTYRPEKAPSSFSIPSVATHPVLGGAAGAAAGYGFGGRRGAAIGAGIGALTGLGHGLYYESDIKPIEAYPLGGALAGGLLSAAAASKLKRHIETPVKSKVIGGLLERIKNVPGSEAVMSRVSKTPINVGRIAGIGAGIGGAAGLTAYLSKEGYIPEGGWSVTGGAVLGSNLGAAGHNLLKLSKGKSALAGGITGGIGGLLYHLYRTGKIPEDFEGSAAAGYLGGAAGALAGHRLAGKPLLGAVAGGGAASLGAYFRSRIADNINKYPYQVSTPNRGAPGLFK